MKHMFKAIMAIVLSLLLALSMFALAENEATEVETLDEEIAAENVDAVPGEADAELSEEIEADLTLNAEVEAPEETSEEVQVEEEAPEAEEDAGEESSEEESSEKESVEEESSEDEDAAEDADAAEEASSDEESSEDVPVVEDEDAVEGADVVEDAETPAEAETADAEALMERLTDEAAVPLPLEGLVYTGEPQALVTGPDDGTILYSLDGENYSPEIPTGVNAGEYTVFYKMTAPAEPAQEATEDVGEEADEAVAAEEAQEAVQDAEAETVAPLTVTIAKADVTLIPPIAFNVEE